MTEAVSSSEMSVSTRATRFDIPEDGSLHGVSSQRASVASYCYLADSFALMIEAMRSSETSVLTKSARRHIPENCVPYCHRCEILKSYIALTG
jgi:hypothetical protein